MDRENEIAKMNVFDSIQEEYFDSTDAIKVNRTFKDSSFRYIFSKAEEFVELYYSLTGTKLSPNEIEAANLDSLVIADWHNDVSFVSKDRHIIVFLEQQSSLCANMSIRCLVYYSNLIRKLYEGNDGKFKDEIYSKTLVNIPKPEFYILYIGSKTLKQEEEYLSDHFYEKDRQMINLKVVNVDIHYDKLNKLSSKSLLGYSYFVDRYNYHVVNMKKPNENMDRLRALELAKEDCRAKGFLLEYIDRREFLIMAQKDFTFNDYVAVKERDAERDGKAEGKAEVVVNMLGDGLDVKIISKYTGLTEKEIEHLADKVNKLS